MARHDETASARDASPRPVFALDDSEADLRALRRVFDRLGLGGLTTWSDHGAMYRALDDFDGAAANELPAYLLLDINLPGRNGFEILGDLRSRFPALPVVMLSGSARPEDVNAAYEAGARGFLSKPLGLDALATAIAGVDRYWRSTVSAPDRLRP